MYVSTLENLINLIFYYCRKIIRELSRNDFRCIGFSIFYFYARLISGMINSERLPCFRGFDELIQWYDDTFHVLLSKIFCDITDMGVKICQDAIKIFFMVRVSPYIQFGRISKISESFGAKWSNRWRPLQLYGIVFPTHLTSRHLSESVFHAFSRFSPFGCWNCGMWRAVRAILESSATTGCFLSIEQWIHN